MGGQQFWLLILVLVLGFCGVLTSPIFWEGLLVIVVLALVLWALLWFWALITDRISRLLG